MLNRYALNFCWWFIGGSLGQGLADYRQASSLKSMDKTQSLAMAVHIIKEGKLNDFVKTINKMQLGSTDLTFKELQWMKKEIQFINQLLKLITWILK